MFYHTIKPSCVVNLLDYVGRAMLALIIIIPKISGGRLLYINIGTVPSRKLFLAGYGFKSLALCIFLLFSRCTEYCFFCAYLSLRSIFRSTPCPAAKTVDEWLSPEQCENGDDCGYCHTRTEQQFHPEIYKSTKCNDIVEHGYCPRAVFCAFAHHESEFHIQRTPYRKPIERPTTPIPLQQVSRCGSNLSPSSHADSSSADVSSLISSSTTAYSVLLDQSENESLSYLKDDDLTVKTYSKALGYDPTQISPRSSVDSAIGRIRTSSFTLGQLDLGCSVTSDNIVSSLPTFSSLSSVRRLTAEKPSRTLPLAIDELSVEDVTSAISSLSNRQQQTQGNDILTSTSRDLSHFNLIKSF
ncbi:hypothetical protein AB6A40_010990 [Gnathostoma spinigerum]|uniref:C3H1-type domain-containing protein n=1 Tax=Gnathostoma spinigerum TaxID=75299 RepID=A0ABD6F271_9BILA